MTTEDFKRKLTAILSADVVGYSRLMGDDESATVKTLETYKRVMSSLIKQHRGRVVDSPGDNLLAEFASVVDAVKCAVQIQKDLKEQNKELLSNRKMEFRIGINIGDVIYDNDRIYGDGVNVAARIESLADPSGICLSRTAYDQVKGKIDIDCEYLGEHEVKNIKGPVRVYKIQKEKSEMKITTENKASSASGKPSIVVLPFINISGDPEQEYFSDGMTEEIINALANVEGLKVISRTSSFFFKGKDVSLSTVGTELNVANVIEGSVRKAGNKIRITAQLIKVADDTHLWSKTYDRELEDVFAIQDEISKAIVDSLKIRLFGKEKESFIKTHTVNIAAYEAYIKGRFYYLSGNMEKALYNYNQAIEFDSEYAPAYSAIAEYYWYISLSEHRYNVTSKAREAINTALEIDNNLPEGHATLGLIKFFYELDWDGAEKAFETAIRLNPGLSKSHCDYALYLALRGNVDRSILEAKKAVELDPLSGLTHCIIGLCLSVSGQFDHALRELSQASEMSSLAFIIVIISFAQTYIMKGMLEEAMVKINKGFEFFPKHPILLRFIGNIYARKGEKAKTRKILDELIERSKKEYVSPIAIAALYADLGEIDQALEYLEEGYEKRDIFFVQIKALSPIFLNADYRFDAFIKKTGL